MWSWQVFAGPLSIVLQNEYRQGTGVRLRANEVEIGTAQ